MGQDIRYLRDLCGTHAILDEWAISSCGQDSRWKRYVTDDHIALMAGPLGQTFHRCLEEAQGIARSTLFGPIVRKEAVMAMLILSVWSQNGWLPCG